MPSISQHLRDGWKEPKYDGNYTEKLQERVKDLNVAQLQGFYNHLEMTKNNSKSKIWADANKQIMDRIEEPLTKRRDAANKITMQFQEAELKKENKMRMQKQERKEAIRVQKMIESNARERAAKEVKAEEDARKAIEKTEINKKIFAGEERRDMWWKRIVAAFIVMIIVVCVVVKELYILLSCIGVIVILCGYLAYRAYHFAIIFPKVVTDMDIEEQVANKQDLYVKEAREVIREKERKHKEGLRIEKLETKRRKEARKAKEALEAEQLEYERLERITLAREAMVQQQREEALRQKKVLSAEQAAQYSELEVDEQNNLYQKELIESEDTKKSDYESGYSLVVNLNEESSVVDEQKEGDPHADMETLSLV